MQTELIKKNEELQKENEKLATEICALRNNYYNFIHLLQIELDKQKEKEKFLYDQIELLNNKIREMEKRGENRDAQSEFRKKIVRLQKEVIESQRVNIENFKKAPKANKENTEAFWEPYRQKFDAFIAAGKSESWAKNEIGKLIERDGVWKKASKKDPKKFITRPNRATLHLQLVTKRK